MLDAVQHLVHPGQRVLRHGEDRLQAELFQPPVGDEADIGLDLLRLEARDAAHLEGEVDEGVLVPDHRPAGLPQVPAKRIGPHFGIFADEGAEEADRVFRMQGLVARRPGHDLPHPLHFAEAREVQQDGEARKKLDPFREGAEHRQRARDVLLRVRAELLHVVVFVAHRLVAHEGRILDFRHPDRVQQMAVGGDMHRLDIGECRQHHLHLGRLEDAGVMLHVAVVHLDIGLGEEAEDLGEQVPFGRREDAPPVGHVVGKRHLFRQPVDALLREPRIVSPRIAEGLVGRARVEKRHGCGTGTAACKCIVLL